MKGTSNVSKTRNAFLIVALLLFAAVGVEAKANIQIVVTDGVGEGFNDPTPATPVGGNPGTTLGQQRLYAFTYAANLWAQQLDSGVTIVIEAAFNPLATNVLGSAGARSVFRDFVPSGFFPGPMFPFTWYGSAIADKLAGRDLAVGGGDITCQFNSDFDFYLGVDRNFGTKPDLVTVLLHEFAHGLGFQNFVTESSGANAGGFTDVYSQMTLDLETGLTWSQMNDTQRAASAIRWGGVVWTGGNVRAALPRVLNLGSPELRVTAPASVAKVYRFATANFGPTVGSAVSANIAVAYDAINTEGPTPTDGCTPLTNASEVNGKIALIDRGTCTFAQKVLNAQNAGALAVIIQNSSTGAFGTMGGTEPSVTIPAVMIGYSDGLAIRQELPNNSAVVPAVLGSNPAVYTGADAQGRARLYAPNPVESGSSISHYDSFSSKNLLMEPAINTDLTHELRAPADLSVELMRDIGWFPDADLDGISNKQDCSMRSNLSPTVVVRGVDSGVANTLFSDGCTIADRIQKLPLRSNTRTEYVRKVTKLANDLLAAGSITQSARDGIVAALNPPPLLRVESRR